MYFSRRILSRMYLVSLPIPVPGNADTQLNGKQAFTFHHARAMLLSNLHAKRMERSVRELKAMRKINKTFSRRGFAL